MGVYQRKDSPFWWALIEGTGKKFSTKIPVEAYSSEARKHQRRQAEEIYRAVMTDAARARHELPPIEKPPVPSFTAFADWYEVQVTARKRGKEREAFALRHLRKHFEGIPLDAITPAEELEYITVRMGATPRPAKPRTVNREVAVLRAMLTAAVAAGHLKASPLAGRKLVRTTPYRKRVLTQAEEDRLLEALPVADRVLYVVAVDTLMRLSNVLNLRWADDHGTYLQLEDSKTGPYRVPLSTRARQALDLLPKVADGYVFAHRRRAKTDGDRRAAIRLMLTRACKRAGIPYGRAVSGVTFHTGTRATGATRMLRAGVDPRTVQRVGNWATFEQMADYLETSDPLMADAVNRIGAGSTVSITPATRENEESKKKAR